jgi:hypothetical protein
MHGCIARVLKVRRQEWLRGSGTEMESTCKLQGPSPGRGTGDKEAIGFLAKM